MKRFVFSMQKILDLREFEKKQAEAELSKALAEENRIQETLKMVATQRAQTISVADDMKDINDLHSANNFLSLLEKRKEDLLEQLVKAQFVTEEKRNIMRQAIQNVKVLENLKKTRFAEWKKQALKEEEIVIDDIVTSRAGLNP